MRWSTQATEAQDGMAEPSLLGVKGLLRSVRSPEFAGMLFHEVLAKSALNKVPATSSMPFSWTVNPYRGCSHACVYCFARNTHRYLDLDSGQDFDRQVVVKVNVAEVLAAEVAKPRWGREPVMLGTNTDPYQRAEGRYGLMPGIIEALAEHGTPISILTKGTLLRRDLPALARAAEDVRVHLSMSIAIYDETLQQAIEPGTPTAAARLATVRAAADRGFRVTVFLMPVLPRLTDSVEHLDGALRAIREAGAHRVVYGALHLRPGAREWFMEWLGKEHPGLLPRYRRMYAHSSYASKEYRRWLGGRIRPLIERHGLNPADNGDYPRGAGPSAAGESPTLTLGAVPSPALF